MSTTPPPFSQPLDYYTGLITSEYRANVAPKFNAWLTANLNLFQDAAACARSMLSAFDLNTAVGAQLDVAGVIIGRSRTVPFQPSAQITSRSFTDPPYNGQGIIFDGAYIWQASPSDSALVVLKRDPATGNILSSVSIGSAGNGPNFLAYDGTRIWVVLPDGTITRFTASTGVIVGTPFNSGIGFGQMLYDGTSIWMIGNPGSGGFAIKINPSTGAILNTVTLTGSSTPFGIVFDGSNLWVTDEGGNLYEINPSTATVTNTYSLGGAPCGLAFDGTFLWVANNSSGLQKVNLSGSVITTFAVTGMSFGRLASIPGFLWIVNTDFSSPGNYYIFNTSTGAFKSISTIQPLSNLCVVGDDAWMTSIDTTLCVLLNAVFERTPSPVLGDDDYRLLLRSAVFQNHWNGQIDSFQSFWSTLFPGGQLIIDDHQDMTADVILQGQFTQIVQDLIFNGMIVPRPQGVLYTYVFPDLPMFGFDLNSPFIAGFDLGKFV